MITYLKRGKAESARAEDDAQVRQVVEATLRDIEIRGDKALRDLSKRFDNYEALLRKSADDRTSPFPGHTYLAATVIGIPSAVKRLRTAARIWTSATWRSKSRDISRWPSSFTQFIFASTLLRR